MEEVQGENCRWQFARKPSDGNWFANREVSGSRNVTELPVAVRKETFRCKLYLQSRSFGVAKGDQVRFEPNLI